MKMEIRPYISFNDECNEAIELYKSAFNSEVIQIMRFRDLPENPNWEIPERYMDRVVQVTMKFGDNFIRMSDCGPMQKIKTGQSERTSIAVEAGIEEIRSAFEVLSVEGIVGMDLAETFYSPCAGVVFDKFDVMWNLTAVKEN